MREVTEFASEEETSDYDRAIHEDMTWRTTQVVVYEAVKASLVTGMHLSFEPEDLRAEIRQTVERAFKDAGEFTPDPPRLAVVRPLH